MKRRWLSITMVITLFMILTGNPAHAIDENGIILYDDMLTVCEQTLGGEAFDIEPYTFTTPVPRRSGIPSQDMIAWFCYMDYGENTVIVENVKEYCLDNGYNNLYRHAQNTKIGLFQFKVTFLYQCI